jgi:hypothetical protein
MHNYYFQDFFYWANIGEATIILINMCGVPMDATFHGGSNDTIGGRRYHQYSDLQKEQLIIGENLLAVSLTPVNSLSAVSLTPANNLLAVSLTPAI